MSRALPLIQRKCACGAGVNGECEACRQRSRAGDRPSPQAKLHVNRVGDRYEHEADRMADVVMRAADRSARWWSGSHRDRPPPATIQRRAAKEEEETPHVTPAFEESVGALRGRGQALDRGTRALMETRFGHDFSRVRIHADTRAAEMAGSIRARAFTLGSDIFFGEGLYRPETPGGQWLLAHELTHTLQQTGGSGVAGSRESPHVIQQAAPMVQRAETDDSDAVCGGVSDTKSKVNQLVNHAIATARTKSKGKGTDTLITEVYEQLGEGRTSHPGRTKIEDDLESTFTGKEIRQPAQSSTKYQGLDYMLWGGIPVPLPWAVLLNMRIPIRVLGATLKVNGTCIGTDKLGHFFQQGYEYYEIARRKKGGDATKAEEYGIKTELGKYGLATTGVFSNADLQANRQGLKFYDELAADPSMTFDISKYVTSQWNETTNVSLYQPGRGVADKVWANLLTGSWKGEFTNDRGKKLNVPVEMDLRVRPRTSEKDTSGKTNPAFLRGTYSFDDDSGNRVDGTLVGLVTFNKRTVAPGISKKKAVEGVSIQFGWKEAGATGRGVWESAGENLLQGTWGRGASEDDAGIWWAMKQ